MRTSAWLVCLVGNSPFLVVGCTDPAPTTSIINPVEEEKEEEEVAGECEPGLERSCDCPDGSDGRQYCYDDATWGACSCAEEEDDAGAGYVVGDCKPGRYEGEFFGLYNSAFSPIPIPVWAFNISGMPGLAFTLNSKGAAPSAGNEFAEELEISDGYVKGTADGLFPFEGKLTGTLNCKTKEFNATLDGGYALLFEGLGINEAKFKGPVLGKYDVATKSFPCQTGNAKFPKCDLDAPVLATAVVTDIVAASAFPKPDNPSYWDLEETDISLPIFPSSIPQGHGGMGYWWAVWVGDGNVDPNTGKPKP